MMLRSLVTRGWLLGLGLSVLFACGSRSDLDCLGERCALGQGGTDPGLEPDETSGNAGGVAAVGGRGSNPPPEAEPPPPGGGTPDETPSSAELPCAFDGIFDASMLVETAADLALLEGCSEVNGDLAILGLATDDLSELRQLRRVNGTFQLVMSGSLAGLERLESVHNLWLESLDTQSLEPLANLLQIGTGSEDDGVLVISGLVQARNLIGLDNLQAVSDIFIVDSSSLQSLVGLAIPRRQ